MLSLFRFPDGKKSVVVRHLKVVGDIFFVGHFLVGFLEKNLKKKVTCRNKEKAKQQLPIFCVFFLFFKFISWLCSLSRLKFFYAFFFWLVRVSERNSSNQERKPFSVGGRSVHLVSQ